MRWILDCQARLTGRQVKVHGRTQFLYERVDSGYRRTRSNLQTPRAIVGEVNPAYQFKSWRTLLAWRLLATNSWLLLSVISHRWLLSALILRT